MERRSPWVLLTFTLLWFGACTPTAPPGPGVSQPIGHQLTYDPTARVNGGRPLTLTFWTQTNQLQLYQGLVEGYRRIHPEIRIVLVASSYQDHFDKLRAALGSGIGPDLFHMHNEFAETLGPWLAPYPGDQLPVDRLEADFTGVDSHLIEGRVTGIDTGLMTSAIFYDKEVWNRAGLGEKDIPRTWNQLRILARRLTVLGPDGRVLRAGFDPNGMGTSLLLALDLQQNQPLFDPRDGRHPRVNTPATHRSLEFLKSLYQDPAVVDAQVPPFHEALGSGRAAMVYAWGWAQGWLAEHYPSRQIGTFPVPTWDGRAPAAYDRQNGECSLGVNKNSPPDRQKVAFDVIRYFLADDHYLADLCRDLSLIPTKRSLIHDPSLPWLGTVDRTVWPGPLPDFYERTLDETLVDPVVIDHRGVDSCLEKTQESLDRQFETSTFRSMEGLYRYAGEFQP